MKLSLGKTNKLECLSIVKNILECSRKLSVNRYCVIKQCYYRSLLLTTVIEHY